MNKLLAEKFKQRKTLSVILCFVSTTTFYRSKHGLSLIDAFVIKRTDFKQEQKR